MNIEELISDDLKELAQELEKMPIEAIKIPIVIKIPGWSKSFGRTTVDLGKRKYLRPKFTDSLRIEHDEMCGRIEFKIRNDGTFLVQCLGQPNYKSYAKDSIKRLRAVFIFHQFKDEICTKIIEDARRRHALHRKVEEALEPFISTMVAERLTK